MKTLEELRTQVDKADRELLAAFERRLSAVKEIGELKKRDGKPVIDPGREQEKLAQLEKEAGFESAPYVRRLYKEIMDISKDLENKPMFGVLGKHLPHTYSPEIHSMICTDYAYTVLEREEDELASLWEEGRRGVYGGFNVTIPYKRSAYGLCDELTDNARDTGAVNTVVFKEDGKSIGANTDVFGFKYMLQNSRIDPSGKKVLILGTGGAAAAVKTALMQMNAGDIVFVSRTGDIDYTNVYDVCADAQIIVNCTPAGMYPGINDCPVDISRFKNLQAVADIIYNPSVTRLLYDAQGLGIKTAGGLDMLVAQAFMSAALFCGASDEKEAEQSIDPDEVGRVALKLSKKMKNVTVIGMPGSGKTWLGKVLSDHLNRELVDLDHVYTATYGKTPAQTVTEEGEEIFREREIKIAEEQLSRSGLVISCGGGIVVRKENFFPLRCNSTVFYNERPLEVLSMNNRPISVAKGAKTLFEERRESYESLADHVISVGAMDTREEYLEEAVKKFDEAFGS